MKLQEAQAFHATHHLGPGANAIRGDVNFPKAMNVPGGGWTYDQL